MKFTVHYVQNSIYWKYINNNKTPPFKEKIIELSLLVGRKNAKTLRKVKEMVQKKMRGYYCYVNYYEDN